MDDVAREMAISKKTIYKCFENKADLIHRSVITIYEEIREMLNGIHEGSENAIDELFEVHRVLSDIMKNHNPSLRFQLQKYYPETYRKVYEGTNEHVHRVIKANIEKGKASGLYRENADTQIVTYLYCSKMEHIPEDENTLLEEYPMQEIAEQALQYHIRGLATREGLEYLEKKLKES